MQEKKPSYLQNESGVSMVQLLIIGATIFAIATGVFRVVINQSHKNESLLGNIQLKSFIRGLNDVLSTPEICIATLNQNGEIKDFDHFYEGILAPDKTKIYPVVAGGERVTINGVIEIKDIFLEQEIKDDGVRLSKFNLHIKTKPFFSGTLNDANVSTLDKTSHVTIWAIMDGRKVLNCTSGDETGVVIRSYIDACVKLGGSFDETSGKCESAIELLDLKTKLSLCSPKGFDSCKHPYKDKICTGSDIRGVNYKNWFVSGFDKEGEVICSCIARICPHPSTVCEGNDLGTDFCQKECGKGTKRC